MRNRIGKMALIVSVFFSANAWAQGVSPLNSILDDVRRAYNKQERPVVVFDIDGTLFDNRSRTQQILKEYAEQELKTARPEAAQKLLNVNPLNIRYMMTDTLAALGVSEPAVVNNAAVFWSERFFKDDYLKYDQPTPGSVTYVRILYSNGARIVYLSGRDAPRQLIGTVKSLRDNGFPIGIQGTELILKPTVQTQDAIFKQQVTTYLKQFGRVIAAFDSEPANTNVFRTAFPEAKVVLYAAPKAPNPPALLPDIGYVGTFQ